MAFLARNLLKRSGPGSVRYLSALPSASTRGTVHFFDGTKDGGPAIMHFGEGDSNLRPAQARDVEVLDMRALDPPPSLRTHGCEFVRFPSQTREADFTADPSVSNNKIENTYYSECRELAMKRTGAVEAVAYHHRHREQKNVPHEQIKGFAQKPVTTFHIDNDAATAEVNLRNTLGDERAEEWLKGHWGIVNIWRPLGDVVRQMPLGLVDTRSYPIIDATFPIRTKGNYKTHFLGLKGLPEYIFYYVSNLAPDEALVFVDFDSASGSSISGLGHGAFIDHNSPSDAPMRRSAEVRCLVRYDD